MKAELLEKLLDAGFTKDEIIQLARDEPDQDPNPVEPDQDPNPVEPEPKPVQNPGSDTDNDETEKRLSGIEKNLSDLVKAIQLQNLRNDSFSDIGDSLEDKTDKIMMSIIRPEPEKKG